MLTRLHTNLIFKVVVIYLAIAFTQFYCKNNSVDSGKNNNDDNSGTVNLKNFYLFVGNFGGTQVYIIDIESKTIIDSICGFESDVWDMIATKSGHKLYVCTRKNHINTPGSIYSVDIPQKSINRIISKSASVYIPPIGNPLIIVSEPYENLRKLGIIDTTTDQITWVDTLDILDNGNSAQSLSFDPKESIFYSLNNNNILFAYDYRQKTILRFYKGINYPYFRMVADPNGRYLYFAGGPVFDIECDSVVGWIGGNYLGTLALSPTSNCLYLTDPGKYLIPEPMPSGVILVWQISTRTNYAFIDVKNATPQGYGWQTDRIVISPDYGTAFVSNWIELIYVIDLKKLSVRDTIILRRTAFQGALLALLPKF